MSRKPKTSKALAVATRTGGAGAVNDSESLGSDLIRSIELEAGSIAEFVERYRRIECTLAALQSVMHEASGADEKRLSAMLWERFHDMTKAAVDDCGYLHSAFTPVFSYVINCNGAGGAR